ncbi:MAG: YncE family protein, partial [Actinomycetales bacterium]
MHRPLTGLSRALVTTTLAFGCGAALLAPRAAAEPMLRPAAYSVVSTIAVGPGPGEVAVSRDGRRAYVTNEDANSV